MNRDQERPFLQHLLELKRKIFMGVAFYVLGACVSYLYVESVLIYITKPIGSLYFTSPAGAFLARMSLSLWGGLFLSSPVLLFLSWRFISPGLLEKEKKYILLSTPVSILLFVIGALFAFFVALPISLKFFLAFSSEHIIPLITVNNYIQYVGVILFVFGLVFEVPLVIVLLHKIGIVSVEWLKTKRRYMVVMMLFLAAFITPQDVFSMLIVAAPFIVLYEIGVFIVSVMSRQERVRS
ncbi:MAG: twin-arginine translocase subunit TatC [Candidatus Omnitrophica bacterium]|nr:twin-arginine translocase subunit TatC [Candidatus Omnitrophota bacterium]